MSQIPPLIAEGNTLKKSLDVQIAGEVWDEDNNILALCVTSQGKEFVICSIYGPNNTSHGFLANLEKILRPLSSLPIIIEGEWNCTFSCLDINSNPDIAGMVKLHNLTNSQLLGKLCSKLNLTDPFRTFSPTSHNFTYVPRD